MSPIQKIIDCDTMIASDPGHYLNSDYILSLHKDPRSLPQETQKKILAAAYLLANSTDSRNEAREYEQQCQYQCGPCERENIEQYGGIPVDNSYSPTTNFSTNTDSSPPTFTSDAPFEISKDHYDMQIVTQTLSGNGNNLGEHEKMDEPLLIPSLSSPSPSPSRLLSRSPSFCFARQKLIPSRRAFSFSRRSSYKKRTDDEEELSFDCTTANNIKNKNNITRGRESQSAVPTATATQELWFDDVPSPSTYTTPSPKRSSNNCNKKISKLQLLHRFQVLRRRSKKSTEYQQFDKHMSTHICTGDGNGGECGTPDTIDMESTSLYGLDNSIISESTTCSCSDVHGEHDKYSNSLIPMSHIEFDPQHAITGSTITNTLHEQRQEVVLTSDIESDVEVILIEKYY